jgi:hypothetical protein
MSGELLEKLFQELSTVCVSETPREMCLRIALEDVIHSFGRFDDRTSTLTGF